jgi:hypothetical protein
MGFRAAPASMAKMVVRNHRGFIEGGLL